MNKELINELIKKLEFLHRCIFDTELNVSSEEVEENGVELLDVRMKTPYGDINITIDENNEFDVLIDPIMVHHDKTSNLELSVNYLIFSKNVLEILKELK